MTTCGPAAPPAGLFFGDVSRLETPRIDLQKKQVLRCAPGCVKIGHPSPYEALILLGIASALIVRVMRDMPRPPRRLPPSGMLHLICRGNNGMRVFRNATDFEQFRYIIGRYIAGDCFFLHHYVFMHTHIHLLAWVEDTRPLAALMKAMTLAYSSFYRKRYSFRGHIWHSRFRSIIIADESHWGACGRYIELNPVRAGICSDPRSYRWSSYHHYADGKKDRLLRPVKGILGSESDGRAHPHAGYREFILAGMDSDPAEMRRCYSKR